MRKFLLLIGIGFALGGCATGFGTYTPSHQAKVAAPPVIVATPAPSPTPAPAPKKRHWPHLPAIVKH